ncbi:hypothetical protein AAHE18_06G143900 [Arachis hypogaea]
MLKGQSKRKKKNPRRKNFRISQNLDAESCPENSGQFICCLTTCGEGQQCTKRKRGKGTEVRNKKLSYTVIKKKLNIYKATFCMLYGEKLSNYKGKCKQYIQLLNPLPVTNKHFKTKQAKEN